MKTDRKTKLKSQSAENEQQCWDALISSVAIYPNMVLIDATRAKDGHVNYRIYKGNDNDDLEMLGVALLYYPSVRKRIVASEHGRAVYGLTDNSSGALPCMIAKVGARMRLPEDEVVSKSNLLPYSAISTAVPTDQIVAKLNDARLDQARTRCLIEMEQDT